MIGQRLFLVLGIQVQVRSIHRVLKTQFELKKYKKNTPGCTFRVQNPQAAGDKLAAVFVRPRGEQIDEVTRRVYLAVGDSIDQAIIAYAKK